MQRRRKRCERAFHFAVFVFVTVGEFARNVAERDGAVICFEPGTLGAVER